MTEPADESRPQRTITLTHTPPVRIYEDEWPVLAFGKWHEGALEFQARKGWMYVRQHRVDRRAIVYGGIDSPWASERPLRAGEIVGDGISAPTSLDIVDGIMRVSWNLGASELFARDMIARLPAVEI